MKVNQRLIKWLERPADDLLGRPIHDLLSVGGRIAFETHLAPLLRLQGFVDEIALDLLHSDGSKIPVIANAAEKRDAQGKQIFTRLTLFRAVHRRGYERGLIEARDQAQKAAEMEHEVSVLREQFIAVLGHDLKNPLAALAAGVRMLADREQLSERGGRVIKEMGASVSRATALVTNVLDFARGRLGGGLTLARTAAQPLTPVLEQVVSEVRTIAPDREIIIDLHIERPVDCDPNRIAQLASNLISNAATHGAPGIPIEVDARTADGRFILTVTNGGVPIPAAARALLFQPFFRGMVRPSQQGLGLGLFIVNEIAKAHNGTVDVISTEEFTCFKFSMPAQRNRS